MRLFHGIQVLTSIRPLRPYALTRLASTCAPAVPAMIRHLTQSQAIAIDNELFTDYQFSVIQLMELAGLSCAQAIAKCYPLPDAGGGPHSDRVLVLCGPGNNGGDGLVCARHLALFGYQPTVVYDDADDAAPPKELFKSLVEQVRRMRIPLTPVPPSSVPNDVPFGLVVDAVFGFSFRPPVRPKWLPWMNLLRTTQLPIVSIDIPSGWHVETGPDPNASEADRDIQPAMLISLTAPKLCARFFTGQHHYLGGRFVPPQMANSLELNLPAYPGVDQCVRLPLD